MSVSKTPVKIVRFSPLTLRKDFGDETRDYGLLSWSIRMGYPRISVFTSNVGNKETFDYSKMITAPLDYITLQMFFKAMERVIDSEVETKEVIECYNVEYVNNVKTDNIILQAKVTIGKDAEGIVYLAATEESKRKIRFDLMPNGKWYKHFDKDGKPYPKNVLSQMYSKAYLATLKVLMESEVSKDMSSVKSTGEVKKDITQQASDAASELF